MTRDVQNRNFISVWFRFDFEKKSDLVRNEFGLVRFEKSRFGLDIVVIYYLCNT